MWLRKAFDRSRQFLIQQLKQGASAEGLALTCAVGFALALFPALGTTTALCLLVGLVLKLNQPTLQAVNYLLAPVQLLLIPVFLNMGAWIFSVPAVSFNPKTIIAEFFAAPGIFFVNYGMAGLRGMVAWLLVMPVIAAVAYLVLKVVFQNLQKVRR
ncbi:DUF2062 domain-containing protein [Bdellovibrio sp. ZAP7]|uniref:DUF2062 domain-containing protein n=1 Tax=Bdellovibrio sp. ZAP7 TaxID=2231053 RepID=UPI00115BBF05|nr:DUF2062 domain-containing protein [Bdellovibrio sp. ZAP7]QDK44597.1 DUF2062 domain-containing protein [Bdellovibrio sp. ZAP7]